MVLYFTWKEYALFIGKMPEFGEEDSFPLIGIQSLCLWVSESRETLHQSKPEWNLDASIYTLQRLASSHMIFTVSHGCGRGLYRDLCLCKPLR